MAKKRRKSHKQTKSFNAELAGVLLILISIMGFGSFGPVGNVIKDFCVFLMGTWYIFSLIGLLCTGAYMLIERQRPNFWTVRLIGFYMILIALLAYSHMEYAVGVNLSGKAILDDAFNSFMKTDISLATNSGGGLIGALFCLLFTSMFDFSGTKIVLVVITILGVILTFDLNIGSILDAIKGFFGGIETASGDEKEDKEEKEETKVHKGLFGKKDEKEKEDNHPDDMIGTRSLENVKVYTASGELAHEPAGPTEQMQLELTRQQELNVETSSDNTNENYTLPTIDILDKIKPQVKGNTTEFLQTNKAALERVLNDFQITGSRVVEIHEGPAVTQFEVEIKAGTKVSRITSINKEIALALAAKDVRIEAPIPGKSTVGVEIPNAKVSSVPIREVISRPTKDSIKAKIPVALGKDIMGQIKWADISKMPHLLVAGSTGSGKSVCINSFIASILMTKKPDEVKLVMVDPKKVELSNYNGIPHLLWPVVTDPKKASAALQKVVIMMEKRYDTFSDAGVKNIAGYNDWVDEQNKKEGNAPLKKMFYLVVIIDELADLMVVASKEVEDSIMRITQMARAAGIHLIVATQRPSTDVITGVVKANIPSRISFAVASQIDSRTILDMGGAEKLLGKGDMLYLPMGENVPTRIQGNFISDDEIERLIKYVSDQQGASYDKTLDEDVNDHMAGNGEYGNNEDPLYNEIIEFAVQSGKISASLLQRRFKIGYNRAARMVDLLEERGIVGPQNGSKPREVLLKKQEENQE